MPSSKAIDENAMDAHAQETITGLVVESRKRTLEMFLSNYGMAVPEDFASQRLKLLAKLNDEFSTVKHLPPPQAQARPAAAPAAASGSADAAPATSSKAADKAPAKPTALEAQSIGSKAIDSLPGPSDAPSIGPSRPDPSQSSALIVYSDGAAVGSKGPVNALIQRKTMRTLMKPDWHAPWKLMRVISGHQGWVRCVAVDPANEWFATGSADRTIKIWDLASGTLKLTLTGHISVVRGVAVSARHPYLFSVGEDKMVKCWDLEYNKVIRHYHGHLSGVFCVSMHPTLDVLVTGGRDSSARVWDVRTKNQIFALVGHKNTVASVVTQAADPQVITGGMDNTVRLWDLAAGKASAVLTHHKKSVRGLAIHPQEYAFVSASADNLKKWRCPRGEFVQNFSGHRTILNAVAVNREGVMVSGGDTGSIYAWDWRTAYNFQQMQTPVQPGSLESEAGVFALEFDRTGSRLISCDADKSIKIYREDTDATPETHPIDFKPDYTPKRW